MNGFGSIGLFHKMILCKYVCMYVCVYYNIVVLFFILLFCYCTTIIIYQVAQQQYTYVRSFSSILHPSKIGTGNGMSIVTPKKYSTVLGFSHTRLTQHRLKIFILREKFLHEFLSPTLPSNHAP